jgi:hypothetical protein
MSLDVFLQGLDPEAEVEVRDTGPPSAEAFFEACTETPDLPDRLVVAGLETATPTRYFYVSQKSQARIFVDTDAGQVHKRVDTFADMGVVAREAEWLDRLAGSGRTPQLLRQSERVLESRYLGEPIRHHNIPADWRDQAEDILRCLTDAGCRHNDIKCDNLVVANGRISLIDFGWATADGEPIPPGWPEQLGRQHRLGVHRFDDRHAIFAACRSAAENRVDRSRRVKMARP